MRDKVLFLVGPDAEGVGSVLTEVAAQGYARRTGVCSLANLDEVLDWGDVGVLVVWLQRHEDFEALDQALWAASKLRRPVPVVALVERYDPADALLCFQLGVDDYLSLAEQHARIGRVLGRLLTPRDQPAGSGRVRAGVGMEWTGRGSRFSRPYRASLPTV